MSLSVWRMRTKENHLVYPDVKVMEAVKELKDQSADCEDHDQLVRLIKKIFGKRII